MASTRSRKKPLKVGVKYCGGCNPQYDRSEFLEVITKRLKGRVEFVEPIPGEVDSVLVIAGCEVACADVTPFKDITLRWITRPEQAEEFIEALCEVIGVQDRR